MAGPVLADERAGQQRCGASGAPSEAGGERQRVGRPRAEQHELFTRFFRSSTAEARQIQGTGLGLIIVDSVVRQHGGRVTVRSDHLAGSTFTVDLPMIALPARTDEVPAQVPRSNDPAGSQGPPT